MSIKFCATAYAAINRRGFRKISELFQVNMSSRGISVVVFLCVFGAAPLGMLVSPVLPVRHQSSESKDIVRLGMGLVAMTVAVALGLLVSSAKDFLRHAKERGDPTRAHRLESELLANHRLPFSYHFLTDELATNLDGDGALQPRVSRTVHLTHSARAERRRDFIRPKLLTWSQSHRWAEL